jgi:hypothetical protein
MFVIEREDEAYECEEEDPGPEEHIDYKGRLLRCPACLQPVPVRAYYDGAFQIHDDEAEELQWTWRHACTGKEG